MAITARFFVDAAAAVVAAVGVLHAASRAETMGRPIVTRRRNARRGKDMRLSYPPDEALWSCFRASVARGRRVASGAGRRPNRAVTASAVSVGAAGSARAGDWCARPGSFDWRIYRG